MLRQAARQLAIFAPIEASTFHPRLSSRYVAPAAPSDCVDRHASAFGPLLKRMLLEWHRKHGMYKQYSWCTKGGLTPTAQGHCYVFGPHF